MVMFLQGCRSSSRGKYVGFVGLWLVYRFVLMIRFGYLYSRGSVVLFEHAAAVPCLVKLYRYLLIADALTLWACTGLMNNSRNQ